jgi:uncharacterized protein YqhQ
LTESVTSFSTSGPGSIGSVRRPQGLRVGGMALENGLLLHTAEYWAAAVREKDGSVGVASGAKLFHPVSADGGRWPVLRGLARLGDALAVIPVVKARLRSAVLPLESPRILGALVGSTLATSMVRRGRGPTLGRELGALLLGLGPTLVALRGSDLAAYHGAEHKSIGEFERALAGGSAAEATKEHERCGSNLVGPLAGITLLSNVVLRRISSRPPAAAVAVTSLLSAGAAMEVYRWMSQHPGSKVARALSWPGRVLQERVTTQEPSADQMEVARAALSEILRLEGVPDPR